MGERRTDKALLIMDVKLSTRGRFTLPKPMREALGWTVGIERDVQRVGNSVVVRPLGRPEDQESARPTGRRGVRVHEH